MSRHVSKLVRPAQRRTPCNVAALAALGLLVTAAPALASTKTAPATPLPVLRGLVSDYSNSATFSTTTTATGQTLTINQLLPKIILDWNSFDIANGSLVQFIQPASTSAVLNRIYSRDPTVIEGAIKANGQVYLVNQNGILFNRGTQINVNTLVASSLNVDDAVFQSGITSGGLFTPAFAGRYDATGKTVAGTPSGPIVVGANGAATAAPSITAQASGAVVIIAPVVNNQSGIITSSDGQVILAAGNSAYLGFSATNSPGFRGMLVEVNADAGPVNLSSMISNSGTISADRGNVTLAGLAINQAGRISASSAMLTNGSIYLQASTQDGTRDGKVTLAAGSVTETPLDTTDATTLHESDPYVPYRSVVQIQGQQIDVEGRITSPGGAVSLNAQDPSNSATPRIYLGSGSLIDASGAWSTASDSSNLLTFKVTSNELKNAPDQKGGLLAGATVTVDLRTGSPLLDLSGYQANQARTLQQKAATGGTVTLTSSGDVIQRSNATIDVAGGGVHYTGVTESTTQLLGSDGKLYDIGSAPEALAYTAIANSFTRTQARWGYSQTFSNLLMGESLKRPDFTEGAAGGSLHIAMGTGANGLVLDGTLLGGSTSGSQQSANAPRAGSLVIGHFDPSKSGQDFGVGDVTLVSGSATSLPAGFGVDSTLSDGRKAQVSLSSDVFAAGAVDAAGDYVTQGFGSVEINSNGRVTLPENVALEAPIGGTLLVRANQVEIDGRIGAPAGSVTLQTAKVPGSAASPIASSGVSVAASASIDTSGAWINNAISGTLSPIPSVLSNADGTTVSTANGGTISLEGPTVNLATGSALAVSAGGSVSTRGVFAGGAGGAIALSADLQQAQGASPLTLDGSLSGYGFATGGSLSLFTSSALQILPSMASAVQPGLNLGTDFFDQGGFQSYKVSSLDDLNVARNAVLAPRQVNLQIDPVLVQALPTGASLQAASRFVTLPDNLRKPTNLGLGSSANLVVQAGASISTDAGASVGLAGTSGVDIDGAVRAPAGAINVSIVAGDQQAVTPQMELGATGVLSTQGAFTATPNDRHLVQGTLSSGGTVTLSAQKAAVVLDSGSVIDVDGASQVVDLPSAPGAASPYRAVRQSSNAGTVSIAADDHVSLGGSIHGFADAGAAGGSFALMLTERGDFADTTSGRRIVVTQSGAPQPTTSAFKDVDISVEKLAGGGFDKLRLTAEDQIVFAGDAALDFQRGVTLDTKLIQVGSGANVLVAGANVTLADSFGQRVAKTPGDSSDPRTVNDSTLASLPVATRVGSGTFDTRAGTLDVTGSVTISGTSNVSLSAANDLQLSGRAVGNAGDANGARLIGSLTTAGDLTLAAAQVYPTTASAFSVAVSDGVVVDAAAHPAGTPTAGGNLTITHGSGLPGDVFSAGGSLALIADDIVQDGVVKAPLGSLSLNAGTTLTLGPTSVTSVSAAGLTIPYGETQNGLTWTYAATGSDPLTKSLTAPPAKNIALSAPSVNVLNGATVDVSGGGDVAAIEWVPGSGGGAGGKVNELLQPNTYAIIPAANLSSAPVDPDIVLTQNLGFGKDSAVYNSIHIDAGGAVPAGDYLLLPSYYGLLKGGYLVQVLTGNTYANLQAGQTVALKNGQTVVPGFMTGAGTSVQASTTVGVLVQPGSAIAKLGDYTLTHSAYFATMATADRTAVPVLPTDGGQLSIAATQGLTLDGTLVATLPTPTSRSAEVDIAATRIALVDQVGRGDIAPDYLQIDTSSLSRLNASLLIGGVRSNTASGEVVTPTATDIIVANSSAQALKAPELVLAATDSITVRSGSVVEGSGGQPVQATGFSVGGAGAASGAILRVSNSGLVDITRPTTDPTQGTITIASGATVGATGSVTLAATRTTSSSGTLAVAAGGALSLVSGAVSLGATDGVAGLADGLVLDNAQLATFNALGTLSIKSYGDIDFYGQALIGSASLANLVIDSPALIGRSAADGTAATTQIAAQQVSLVNSSGNTGTAGGASASAGAFSVAAGQIVVGAGSKSVSGFGDLRLNASGEIVAAGTGSLQTASTLTLQAARIDSQSGASQAWSAQDGSGADAVFHGVTISANAPAATLADSTALGSRLQITGSAVADSGTIVMKSGSVALQAQGAAGSDGVTLSSGATIDAGGATKSFQGSVSVADAGQVNLGAANGAVQILSGSTVNLAAADAGGNAGSLSVVGTALQLDGTLKGTAANGTQGNVSIDVATLPNFSALNTLLNSAGFTESRDVRVRAGDLGVAAGDVVQAHHLTLESDGGTLTVAGRLDASAALGGGSVELDAANVTLQHTASVDASATATSSGAAAAYANGGNVTLLAEGGTLDFEQGAVVDVRAGAKGSAGSVLLRAPRTANSVQATLAGQVLSQRNAGDAAAAVVIEGNRVYGPDLTGTSVTPTMMAGYAADNTAFMSAVDAASVTAALRGDDGGVLANVHVRPAIEVVASGDLQIASNWNLTGAGWQITPAGATASEAGSLVVRAAGDLTLASASLGNPDNGLRSAATWNIGLTSGADLGAANASRTQSGAALAAQAAQGHAGAGDLVLDSADAEASVRTGTGAIRLAAGRDFVIKAGTDPVSQDALVGVVYTDGTAALADPKTVAADSRFTQGGGDITITAQRDAIGAGNEWMTEWYRSATSRDALANGAWWAYRPNFHDGVAVLGGGDLSITSGRDIVDLSAWVPTSAIESGSGANAGLTTFGGGNLAVHAGNDLSGGQYLVALGSGSITAGGDVGAGRASQVFMMGASGDAALAGANVAIAAGGAVTLNTIDNPSSLYQSQGRGSVPSFNAGNPLPVLSYSANGVVSVSAKGGDLSIGNRPADNLTLDPDNQSNVDSAVTNDAGAAILPAKVNFTAFSGNVVYTGNNAGLTTFPSPSGAVKVLAGQGITGLSILVSDAGAAQFAIQNIATASTTFYSDLLANTANTPGRLVANTSTDTFINDVVALDGSIKGVTFTFPTRSRIWAAQDVSNPQLALQNLAAGDVSEVVADQGAVLIQQVAGWGIDGPGSLLIQAGQNVDLGKAALASFGNLRNSAIVDPAGADIDVVAGHTGVIDTTKLDTLFTKLIAAGSSKSTAAAAAATADFFGATPAGKGGIDSYDTSIQSNAGGTVNLLAPAGNITVGLPTENTDKLIGVVTNAGGAIRSYLSGDFNINQGKVLTALGGDILIYTSAGGIDAGRGAKTSVTTPPPTRTPVLDDKGNTIGYKYSVPVAVAGSGIQTATSKPGGPTSVAPPAGNIYLFAPAGTIDAGEAGIASGGTIFIAALTVLNADNISSAGASTGVPQVAVGSLASTVAASGATTATGATPGADAAAQAAAAAAAAGVANFRPAILTVEVLGFGDKNCKETDKDCFAK